MTRTPTWTLALLWTLAAAAHATPPGWALAHQSPVGEGALHLRVWAHEDGALRVVELADGAGEDAPTVWPPEGEMLVLRHARLRWQDHGGERLLWVERDCFEAAPDEPLRKREVHRVTAQGLHLVRDRYAPAKTAGQVRNQVADHLAYGRREAARAVAQKFQTLTQTPKES